MSRTIKQKASTFRKRKIKAYSSDSLGKFKATKSANVSGFDKGVSKQDKLVTRNANRSKKKGVRQNAKKEINDSIADQIRKEDSIVPETRTLDGAKDDN